jgi:hypothetical protein
MRPLASNFNSDNRTKRSFPQTTTRYQDPSHRMSASINRAAPFALRNACLPRPTPSSLQAAQFHALSARKLIVRFPDFKKYLNESPASQKLPSNGIEKSDGKPPDTTRIHTATPWLILSSKARNKEEQEARFQKIWTILDKYGFRSQSQNVSTRASEWSRK